MADLEGKVRVLEARVDNLTQTVASQELVTPIGFETITVEYTHYGDYVYYGSFIVSLGARANRPGDNVGVVRVWANDEIIYDRVARFTKPQSGFRFWDGNEARGVWSPRQMAYKGLMCLQFIKMNLTDYGNSYPAISVELADDVTGFNEIRAWNAQPAFGGPLSGNVELHTASDTIFWEYWVREYAIDYTPLLAKERLSTGVKYFTQRMGGGFGGVLTPDIDTFAPIGGGGTIDTTPNNLNTYVTHIPEIGYMFACGRNGGDTNPNELHVMSLESGSSLGRIDMGFEATSLISFKNTTNNQTDWYVVAADEASGRYGVFRVTDGNMQSIGGDIIAGGIAAFQPGKQTKFFRELFIANRTGRVFSIRLTGNNVLDGGSLLLLAGAEVIRGLMFDPARDVVLVLVCTNTATNKGYAVRINSSPLNLPILVRGDQSAEIDVPPVKRLRAHNAQSTSDTSGGSMLFEAGNSTFKLVYLDLATLDAAVVETSSDYQKFEYFGLVWDSRTEVGYFTNGQKVYLRVPVDFDGPDVLKASEVMRAFAVYAGFQDSAVITTGMDEMPLLGYVVSGDTSLASISSTIGDLYGFTWTESAGRLIYRAIYESGELRIDETIPADRLAYITEGMENPQTMTADRAGDVGMPVSISLSYFNPARAHTAGYQVARRNSNPTETQKAVQPLALSMPITITDAYALELLYGAIYRVWASRVTYTGRLPAEYMRLDATDTIEFTSEGYTYQAQINRLRINADNSIAIDMSEVSGSSYPVQVETQPQIDIPSAADATTPRVVILDIPSVDPTQDQPNYLNWVVIASAYRAGDRFGNSAIQFTNGSDQNEWNTRVSFTADEMGFIGTIINYLPAPLDPFALDTVNSIFVQLDTIPTSKLIAATEEELDGGANLIVIGSGQYCEIIQFANAEPSTPVGVWRLFNLRRGRYGTNVNAGIVAQQSPLSFLDNSKIINYTATEFESREPFYWRSVAQNQPAWQLDRFPITGNGNSRRPYAPNSLKLVRDVDGAIIITWNLTPRFYNSPPEAFPVNDSGGDNLETRVEFFRDDGTIYRVLDGYFGECYYETFLVNADGNNDKAQLNIRVRQYASDTVDYGFAAGGYGIPVYNAGDADISLRIDGAGSVDIEPTITFADGEIRGLVIDGGGSIGLDVVTPGIVRANIDGGGSVVVTVTAVGGSIRMNIDGGGEVSVTATTTADDVHRYWGIKLEENTGGSNYAITELEMRPSHGGPNIANENTRGYSTGSIGGDAGSYGARNAFDGNIGTIYLSLDVSLSPLYLYYDFGSDNLVKLAQMLVMSEQPYYGPTKFSIVWSDDAINWNVTKTYTGLTWGYRQSKLFDVYDPDVGEGFRYWRVFVDDVQDTSQNFCCIGEIEMLSTRTGAPMDGNDETTDKIAFANTEYGILGGEAINTINDTYGDATDIFSAGKAWLSNSGSGKNNWLTVDFGQNKSIQQLRILANHTAGRTPGLFKLQASNDSSTWETLFTSTAQTGWLPGQWRTFLLGDPGDGTGGPGDGTGPGEGTPPAGPVVYRGKSSAIASGTTLTFDKPAGLVASDMLILDWQTVFGGRSIPSEWTVQAGDGAHYTVTRLATAGDISAANISINIGGVSTSPIVGILSAYGNVASIEAKVTGFKTSGTALVLAALTSGGANRMLVVGAGKQSGSTFGYTTPGSMTEIDNVSVTGGADGVYSVTQARQEITAGGSTGSRDFGNPGGVGGGVMLLLKGI